MAKNKKKNRPQQAAPKKPVALPSPVCEPELAQAEEPQTPHVPQAHILFGAIAGELFESIYKPAFVSFDQRVDDNPLRALVESVATTIATRSVYDGCRKLDDVFQRYLYYVESLQCEPAAEKLQTQALCDYWRTQVFITLIRDSRIVYKLLLPNEPTTFVTPGDVLRNDLLPALRRILTCRLGGPVGDASRENATCPSLIDFARGVSFPWIGFSPERLFGLLKAIPDSCTDEPVLHEFAIAMPEQVVIFRDALQSAINETLLIDLVAAQHSKLFAEIMSAHDDDTRLPQGIIETISKRVRFDKTYQAAYDDCLAGRTITKPLHRASRLNIHDLNAVGQLYRVLSDATDRNLGVYLFHFYA